MDSRPLVPFQAVVQAGEWTRAWGVLEVPFRAQAHAYKRELGARHSPELVVGRELRFQDAQEASCMDVTTAKVDLIPVQRTFVHFSNLHDANRCVEEAATMSLII